MIYDKNSTTEIIQAAITEKREKNQYFSDNSFARYLGISQSYLNLVLNKKRKITPKLAEKIIKKLDFNDQETLYFNYLMEIERASNKEIAELFVSKIEKFRKDNNYDELSIDKFKFIADWYYSAVFEALSLSGIPKNSVQIAKKLKLPKKLVNRVLQMLVKLELVEKKSSNNEYQRIKKTPLRIPSQIISQGLRQFHKQVLLKARSSIEKQTLDERHIHGMTMAIDPSKLPEAQKKIRDFTRELTEFLEDGEQSEVYQFSSQLFRLEGTGEEEC